jgi:hypothetical protein
MFNFCSFKVVKIIDFRQRLTNRKSKTENEIVVRALSQIADA